MNLAEKKHHNSAGSSKVVCTGITSDLKDGDNFSLQSYGSSIAAGDSFVPKFEDVLEEIGGFSRMQTFLFVVIYLTEVPSAWMAMITIFIGTVPEWWKCSDASNVAYRNTSEFSDMQQNINLYFTNIKNICYCSGDFSAVDSDSTIVSNWNLICELDWVGDFTSSLLMFGMLIGAAVVSPLADWYGRKRAFYSSITLLIISGMTSGLVSSQHTFTLARFITGMAIGAVMVVNIIYPMEFVTPSWRSACGCIPFWPLGMITLAGIGYSVRNWRHLLLLTSGPWIVYLLTSLFVPESPRWLLKQGKVEEAHEVLNRIATANRRAPMSPCAVLWLYKSIQRQSEEAEGRKYTFLDLFSSWKLAKNTLLYMYAWFVCTAVYYGVPLNSKNISGEAHLNLLYLGLVDLIANPSVIIFNKRFGRRKTFIVYTVFGAGFSAIALVVSLTSCPHLAMALGLAGRFCMTGAMCCLVGATAELAPTPIRTLGTGLPVIFGRLGGVLAPQVVYLGTTSKILPHMVFILMSISVAAISWQLQDISGQPMEDNLPHRSWRLCGCCRKKTTTWAQRQVAVIELSREDSL